MIAWVHEGADRSRPTRSDVKPMLDQRCMSCHDGSNPHLPNLERYDNLKKVTEQDTGADICTLVRVSHIHLFGLTFIFFIIGPDVQPRLCAAGLVQMRDRRAPFVAIMIDVELLVPHQALPSVRLVVVIAGRHA